jgi:hypothetical protein
VYLNITTQSKGTAAQIMQAEMIPNFAIYVPNNSQDYTFELPWFAPFSNDTRYIWSVTSHTHKYGKEFKIFTRNSNGSKDDLIYDADYMDGVPNGLVLGYDYQHPPQRFFNPFLVVPASNGLIQRATYNNNGSSAVSWGNTTDDEMMLLIVYYVSDTAGVIMDVQNGVSPSDFTVNAWPNPAQQNVNVQINRAPAGAATLTLHDLQGRTIQQVDLDVNENGPFVLDVSSLPRGLYFYKFENQAGLIRTGKIVLE